jgi:dTDP-4-dehydrorhamnose reductase
MSAPGKPILIIGGGGMLGRAWRELLDGRSVEHAAPSHAELDITRSADVERWVDERWGAVVNCAGWTDVDGAEAKPQEAGLVNGVAVGELAKRCASVGCTLIHYSTDYVFNGRGDKPYAVDHLTDPVNAYGRSKLEGELSIKDSGCRHLLIRTSWLYAPWGHNFVRTISKLAAERDSIKVVDDQHGRPTSVEHLAGVSLGLIEADAEGTYHVTDGGECTWFGFAREIARHANPGCRVEPCTSDEYPRPAKRPAYSVLDIGKAEALVGKMPDWKLNLAGVLVKLESAGSEMKS